MNAILGEKLGMTQIFDDQARAIPVTVIKAGPCHVVQIKNIDTDGYSAIQIAFGEIRPKLVNEPTKGHFAKAGVEPTRHLVEIRVDEPNQYKVGQEIKIADVLSQGGLADVTGVSKGKGFQGVMKRHGFAGLGAAHGAHKKHRAPGSIGACATPARVFKGKKMPGRMGNDQVTTLNLQIVGIDTERDLLLLRGAVPGANGSLILVREAVKA
ncbi:MAG TPA: 50S ribosomal protein L3 [Acidimicrobiia bacterium]|nr:50S ribosomal protein L3 [Acidimicrobiia bacterium]